MLSSVAIIGPNGEILIHYRTKYDVGSKELRRFEEKLSEQREILTISPIISTGDCNFFHVSEGCLVFAVSTRLNCNAMLALTFLYQLIRIMKLYFSTSKITDLTVRKNIVCVFELIDEIIDYGIPQIMEVDILKRYMTQSARKLDFIDTENLRLLTVQATGATSWRADGIKYRKNGIYVDVVECVNVLVSKQGQILSSDINGRVLLKCQLSGIPECKLGLNKKVNVPCSVDSSQNPNPTHENNSTNYCVLLDDIQFHQCVRIDHQLADHTITFIPPDGEFNLIAYRSTNNIRLPFYVLPTIIERGRARVEYIVKLRSTFPAVSSASNIILKIPCPPAAARADIVTTCGNALLNVDDSALIWRIRRLCGQSQAVLKGRVHLIQTIPEIQWSRPPLTLDFFVPMFTASGLTVRFLRVYEKSNYKTTKWIRYITRAGQYHIRI